MIPLLPASLRRVLSSAPALRRTYLVGGAVRDALLGLGTGKDLDFEVFGVDYDSLASALRPFGRVDLVGRSFGVVKLAIDGDTFDFSIPRRDSKTAPGHRGFEVRFDPAITPREAAGRRDYTINSLMVDTRSGEVLDFFGGAEDLRQRILRHTGPAFGEDPLRVLRGMQFVSRFDLQPAKETLEICRAAVHSFPELAVERVREEWFKWAERSVRPSAGLRFLEATGWIRHFPELAALRGVPQDPEWHPEGDVFDHTAHALDALVDLSGWKEADPTTRTVLSLAVLAHDFGKSTCTQTLERDGRTRIVSPGHEAESARIAEGFLQRIDCPKQIAGRVVPLVANHMAAFQECSERAVRRLARRLAPETVQHLGVVMTADASGRPPLPRCVPESVLAIERVAHQLALADAAPRPILLGRHLLALGLLPGREIGTWTHAAFEAQLDGCFSDLAGAYRWLAQHPQSSESLRVKAARSAEALTTDDLTAQAGPAPELRPAEGQAPEPHPN